MANKSNWFIGIQKRNSTDGKISSISQQKSISENERSRLSTNLALLREVTQGSAYHRLNEKYEDFCLHIEKIIEHSKTKKFNPKDLESIFEKIDDLLSAFRAFDDKTSHKLSLRYGKKSKEFAFFKEALSFEFDNVFAYRLCSQLRNYSQHAGSPITNIKSHSYLEGDQPKSTLSITLDSEKLLEGYSKWNSRVKEELKKINGPLDLVLILDALMNSCSRAYSKYLISQEDAVNQAQQEIISVIGQLESDEFPAIMEFIMSESNPEEIELNIQQINMNELLRIPNLLQKAHFIVGDISVNRPK